MRQQLIITFILSIVLILGLWIRERFFPILTRETTFYFFSLFWISGLLIIAFGANLLWGILNKIRQKETRSLKLKWPNRRKSFRVVYPHSTRPVLLVDKHGGPLKRQLEYPVSDISEKGLCFIDDGSLGPAKEIDGNVRFHNGESNRIVGHIVRRNGKSISVQLHAGFSWKKVLEEQRRLISQMRHGSA